MASWGYESMGGSLYLQKLKSSLRERIRSSVKTYDACRELVRHGDLESAIPALQSILKTGAYGHDAKQLLAVCHQLRRSRLLDDTVDPSALLADLGQVDRGALDETEPTSVLLRRVEGAAETLVVFVTNGGVLWITLALLHHYLREYPVNIVYVRDERRVFHFGGLNGLGVDYESSVASLRHLIAGLGATQVYAMGGSGGGYSALRFGLDLGAAAVMSFSGPTTLAPDQLRPEKLFLIEKLLEVAPAMAADLVPLYAGTAQPPRAILCFGDGHRYDPGQARRMSPVANAQLCALAGYNNHDTLAYFAVHRQFDRMFHLLRGGR